MPLVLNSSSITGLASSGGFSSRQTGEVLQVVQASYATSTTTTGSSLVDTGLTASITPTSSSSKILVLVSMQGLYNGNNTTCGLALAILRGSTNLNAFCNYTSYTNTGGASGIITSAASNYLDSPATTSSTTYKVQFARAGGSGGNSVIVQANSDLSTMILMEIAA